MTTYVYIATSLDGYIADKNGKVTNWTSKEDQEFFSAIKSQHSLFVMGSGTFDPSYVKPADNTLKVILTKNPNKYAKHAVPGKIEFCNLRPQEFIQEYKHEYDECLLLGGSKIYKAFLDEDLVDEIYLTREPVELKEGTPLLSTQQLDLSTWKTKNQIRLNNNNSVLEHYIR